MTTSFLFFSLEPTNGQNKVFVTGNVSVSYSDSKDFAAKLTIIENKMRQQAGNPDYFQFKSSDEFETYDLCDSARTSRINEYQNWGWDIKYLNI